MSGPRGRPGMDGGWGPSWCAEVGCSTLSLPGELPYSWWILVTVVFVLALFPVAPSSVPP